MTRTALVLVALAALVAAGCAGREESAPRSFQAAVVPGADFSLRVNYRSARVSPVGEELARRAVEEEHESGRELLRAFEEAAGVGREDLEAIYFTADLDDIDLRGGEGSGNPQDVEAVLAVAFSRALTENGLRAGLHVLAEDAPGTVVEETEVGGRAAFVMRVGHAPGSEVHAALSEDGSTVFVSPGRKALEGVVFRERERKPERVPPDLARVESDLPQGSQLKSALVLPRSLRREIEERFARAEVETLRNPGSTLFVSFAGPFRGLASLAAGAVLAEGMELLLTADLGGAEPARQAAAIFQTLGVPLLKAKLAERAGKSPAEVADRISVASREGTLLVSLTLTPGDLSALPF